MWSDKLKSTFVVKSFVFKFIFVVTTFNVYFGCGITLSYVQSRDLRITEK